MPDHEALQALLQDRKSPKGGRATRRMDICLSAPLSMTLALAEQDLAGIEAEIALAEATADRRAGGTVAIDPDLTKRKKAAEKAVTDAEAAVDAASVTVTFTAMKANDYDELLKKHPPREGNEIDAQDDRNNQTFPDALMFASATKVQDADGNIVDMDIPELLGTLSNGERIIACQAAMSVNDRALSVPFSDANSRSRRRSGSSSSRR
ncbi:hypothetical protein ACFPJ1_40720 [Kribbella qitaiheensis]|uniref:hypothetical protein n=1 Tax=Kribbella qitaiheensis TaxID=1544730 RepID=UPI0036205CE3